MTLSEKFLESSKTVPIDPAEKILFAVLRKMSDYPELRRVWNTTHGRHEEILFFCLQAVRDNLPNQ